MISQKPEKSMAVAYVLLIFFGVLGIHRFYLGQTGMGLALLLLFFAALATMLLGVGVILLAVVWLWVFVDLFLIPGMVRSANA
jgi:TM2 domain-containing membrane protein YozV